MTKVTIGNIELDVDVQATIDYYRDKPGFLCNCVDCRNYVRKTEWIRAQIKGLDDLLGIDLAKDVGIGSDELMPHNIDDHILYVVPYYVVGRVVNKEAVGRYAINERICVNIRDYQMNTIMKIEQDAFCVWLEVLLPLAEEGLALKDLL